MFAGWFLGQWIGDTRRAWWIAVLGAAVLTLVSAKLTAAAIDWNTGTSSSVGDAFKALFTAAGFWWNVVSVPLVTLIGYGLARAE
jgi:prophage DNA circulation protein